MSFKQSRANESVLTAALEQERAARERMKERHAEVLRAARELRLVAELHLGGVNQDSVSVLQMVVRVEVSIMIHKLSNSSLL